MIMIMIVVAVMVVAVMIVVVMIVVSVLILIFVAVFVVIAATTASLVGLRDICGHTHEKGCGQQSEKDARSLGDKRAHEKEEAVRAGIVTIISMGASFFVEALEKTVSSLRRA